ncbi:uncharacterized protein LOC121106536 isoform X4 [Gallus gallus]|uniref:uncharacterized protein LOC121106536 isoform X4 n=1 Tax=Gallus gallus TaxID=9031 RepID=UPI001F0177A2|nr:uncharacterized protein LOC121106536 isoform X4 [Gallus gallus]
MALFLLGKADRSGGGVSFRGRERERIELHLGMTEEPAERLCVRLKRQGEGCSGELCREGWLEQVCGFPSSGMKEVVCGGLCAGSGWRKDPGGVSRVPLWRARVEGAWQALSRRSGVDGVWPFDAGVRGPGGAEVLRGRGRSQALRCGGGAEPAGALVAPVW